MDQNSFYLLYSFYSRVSIILNTRLSDFIVTCGQFKLGENS